MTDKKSTSALHDHHIKNPNHHLIKNINHYLDQNQPSHALLISGDWGAGKTYFVDSLTEEQNKVVNNQKKIIKISLFGVQKTSEIDFKIFQSLHPILGSKYTQLAGNILKGALSFGFKFEISSEKDKKSESSLTLKLDQLKFLDFFSKDGKGQKLVIIFDDLERSNVDPKELLGYINHTVEISKIHTILVAHEKFLIDNDDKKIYRDFKEKIVYKTFEIRQDHEKVINSFLKETKDKIIISQKSLIQQVYESSKYKNLRSLKQSIFDFKYLLSEIDDQYLGNQKFLEILALTFFALSIEVKKGSISEEDIRKGVPFSSNIDPGDIYKKYFKNQKLSIYTSDIWADIIFKGHSSEVNKATSKLAFFLKENKKEEPYWVKLCTYEELEFEEFSKLLPILNDDLRSNITDSATIYLHKISLAIYFSKNDLLELGMEEIKSRIKEATKNESLLQHWNDQSSAYDFGASGAGYLYLSHNNKEFNEIKKEITYKSKIIYEKAQKEEHRKSLNAQSENLLNCIKSGNLEYFSSILTKIHETNPILQNISPVIFAKTLAEAKNITIAEISKIMGQRYTENKSLNSRVNHYYLAPEIKFWKSVQKHIKKATETTDKIKSHILKTFNERTINEIIIRLSRHSE
jgi:hypothetical protein